MAHHLPTQLAAAWPPENWRDVSALVAVSGGADSVALMRGLVECRLPGEGRLVLAHFNHRQRGAESDADEAFVERLAGELGLPFVVGRTDAQGDGASEESLRAARYEFLKRESGVYGARYVAMAHTADDQVETVLWNVLRGTGLAGLAGIPRIRPLAEATTIVRPLLDVTRADVLDYLAQLQQPFREDASNRSLAYTRNRIRHELLPLLARDYNPHVRQALLRLSNLAGEADDELTGRAAQHGEQMIRRVPGGVELMADPLVLSYLSDYILRTLLQHIWREQQWPLADMSLEKWQQLADLARASGKPPAQNFPGGIRAERNGKALRLTRGDQ
jgi:tRNA(Ile)-lysidine synthase